MIILITTVFERIKSKEIRLFLKFASIMLMITECVSIFLIPLIIFPNPILSLILWILISFEIMFELICATRVIFKNEIRLKERTILWLMVITSIFAVIGSLFVTLLANQFSLDWDLYKAISIIVLISFSALVGLFFIYFIAVCRQNIKGHILSICFTTMLILIIVCGVVVRPYSVKISVLALSFGTTALCFAITYFFFKIILGMNDEAKKVTTMAIYTIIFIAVIMSCSFIVRYWILDDKLQNILTTVAAEIIGGAFTLVSVIITIRVGHLDNKKAKEEFELSKSITEKQKKMPLFGTRLLYKKQLPSNINLCTFKTPKTDDAIIAYSLFANSDNSNFKIVSLTIDDKVYTLEHTHFVLKNEMFGLAFYLSQCKNTNIIMRCKDILNNVYEYQLFFRKTNDEDPFFALYAFEEIK